MTYITIGNATTSIEAAKKLKEEIAHLEENLKHHTEIIRKHLKITEKESLDTIKGRACLVKANRRNWKIERLQKDFGFTETDPRYSSLTPYEFVKLS